MSDEDIVVVSISASGKLHREVDIQTLAEEISLSVSEYKPEMNAAFFRFEENGELMILYPSGKYILRGGDDFDRMYDVNEEFLQELSEAGLNFENPSLIVKNVVSVGDLNKSLDLNALAIELGLEAVEYEPEQFPGLVYRPEGTNCVLLVFGSGKVVITGGKSEEDNREALESLSNIIGYENN